MALGMIYYGMVKKGFGRRKKKAKDPLNFFLIFGFFSDYIFFIVFNYYPFISFIHFIHL